MPRVTIGFGCAHDWSLSIDHFTSEGKGVGNFEKCIYLASTFVQEQCIKEV